MRQKLEQLAAAKQVLAFNFTASAGAKLVSINGTITEIGDDYVMINDIYGNSMLIGLASIAFIEIKK